MNPIKIHFFVQVVLKFDDKISQKSPVIATFSFFNELKKARSLIGGKMSLLVKKKNASLNPQSRFFSGCVRLKKLKLISFEVTLLSRQIVMA